MKFCPNCGNEITENNSFCPNCGQQLSSASGLTSNPVSTHAVPKCTCCGHVGEMTPGPLLRKNDILWIVMLFFLAGAGFIYLAYILITRSKPNNREKICPNCKSQNMFTYVY